MSRATSIIFLDETHPIDALELIAHEENWEFSRDYDNEITVSIDGGWKKYTVTRAGMHHETSLKLFVHSK